MLLVIMVAQVTDIKKVPGLIPGYTLKILLEVYDLI